MIDKVEAPGQVHGEVHAEANPTPGSSTAWPPPRPGSSPGSAWKSTATSRRRRSVVGTGPWMLERYEPNVTHQRSSATPTTSYPELPYADGVEHHDHPRSRPRPSPRSWPESSTSARSTAWRSAAADVALAAKKQLGHWWLPLQTRECPRALGPDHRDEARPGSVQGRPGSPGDRHGAITGARSSRRNPLVAGEGRARTPLIPAALKEWSTPDQGAAPPKASKLYESVDPAGAKQLLTAAGHPGGIKIPVETTPGYGPDWMDAVQVDRQATGRPAGIEAELKLQGLRRLRLRAPIFGKFDKMMLTLRGGTTDPDTYLRAAAARRVRSTSPASTTPSSPR